MNASNTINVVQMGHVSTMAWPYKHVRTYAESGEHGGAPQFWHQRGTTHGYTSQRADAPQSVLGLRVGSVNVLLFLSSSSFRRNQHAFQPEHHSQHTTSNTTSPAAATTPP